MDNCWYATSMQYNCNHTPHVELEIVFAWELQNSPKNTVCIKISGTAVFTNSFVYEVSSEVASVKSFGF